MKDRNIIQPTVYIPAGAKLNFENKDLDPPSPQYNNRAKVFDLEAIKKVVGGEYGRDARKGSK